MANVEVKPISEKEVAEWYALQGRIKVDTAREKILRARLFKGLFPAPHEGTNTTPIGEFGWVVKGDYKLNRKIDEGALNANIKRLREEFAIPVDTLIKYKPELSVSAYRKLTEEQVKQFDNVLIVSEGLPGLEIVLPKKGG